MRLTIYLTFLLLFLNAGLAWSQEKFTKKELYSVWMIAEEKLDAGKFNEALALYKSYPRDSSFMLRTRQINVINELVKEGERLYKKEQYAEALDKFKEYRKLRDIGTLRFFEDKIEDCLNQINKGNLSELTSQQRVITGFEFAHRGRQKLSKLDTTGAKSDFTNAKTLGGNANSTLREQYVDGLRIADELSKWGSKNLGNAAKTRSSYEELKALETYRDIRNIDIPEIETRIRELSSGLDGKESLPEIAKLCDIDLLIRHVETNKSTIKTSDFLITRLKEFKSTRQKIDILKKNKTNAETVRSAYTSLISWTDELPAEIRSTMKGCIQNEYSSYVATLPAPPTPRPRNTADCSGLESFTRGITLVRRELSNCNIVRSKRLWRETVTFLNGCNNAAAILKSYASLNDSISRFAESDSILTGYRNKIEDFNKIGECARTAEIYEQMKSVRTCNQAALDQEIKNGLDLAKNCKGGSWWRPQLIGSFAAVMPEYSVGDVKRDMATGWMASGGIALAYIDHKNLAEFLVGVEYFKTSFYSTGSTGSTLEDFTIDGVNVSLGIKLHLPNTNPGKLRPYVRFGPELQVPLSYKYENHSTFTESDDVADLQKTMLFLSGGLGVEIQKVHFGAFLEAFGAAGLGSIYKSEVPHLSTTFQKIEAGFNKFGVKIGVRFW
ncbi:hypothetical protein [Dyadobacter sp. CY323]|uniref:hypothetical protein n=1 Tax=Dyadobacter sp. CY323 TaxID=2907302 RepID=UPI001F4661B0|nr:hypothetical protein [Dyadobacter sp. CY323]MCE6990506.1 hypothetical protein [Dyadobacter sp. CY323]